MKLYRFFTVMAMLWLSCQYTIANANGDTGEEVRLNECISEIFIDSTLITRDQIEEVTKIRVFKKFNVNGNYRVGLTLRKKDALIALYAPLYTSDEADRIISDSLFEMVGVKAVIDFSKIEIGGYKEYDVSLDYNKTTHLNKNPIICESLRSAGRESFKEEIISPPLSVCTIIA